MSQAMPGSFALRCKNCQTKIRVSASAAGARARCPKCQTEFRVPRAAEAPPPLSPPGTTPASAGADRIDFRCSKCAAHIKVPAAAAGRRVKCPKCAAVLSVPAPQAAGRLESDTVSDDDLLGSLAFDQPAPASPSAQRAATCLNCRAPMPLGGVVCVSCGYNAQTGKMTKGALMSGASGGSATKAGAAVGSAVAAGALGAVRAVFHPFLLGCALSAAAALIGAGLWFVVALKTGYEIGWLAWGLGLAAGFGMWIGYRDANQVAGCVAGVLALGGITLGKVLIFSYLIYAFVAGVSVDQEFDRAALAAAIADERLDEEGVFDEDEREARWEEFFAQAERDTESLSDEEVSRRRAGYASELSGDELSGKRSRLAYHFANLAGAERGLAYDDAQRSALHNEQRQHWRAAAPEEVDRAIAQLEAWEAGEKWNDEQFVRHHLIYRLIDQAEAKPESAAASDEAEAAEAESDEEDVSYTPEQWQALYEPAAARVEAMSPAERQAEARRLESEDQREARVNQVGWRHAEARARRQGLAPGDDRRQKFFEEERARAEQLAEEALKQEASRAKAWDEGEKWRDEAFVRDELIYTLASSMAQERAAERGGNYWEVQQEEWAALYKAATAEAEATPAGQRRARIEELEAQAQRSFQAALDADDDAVGEVAGSMLGLFVSSMFGPFDLLFLFLALASAYRLGAHGLSASS